QTKFLPGGFPVVEVLEAEGVKLALHRFDVVEQSGAHLPGPLRVLRRVAALCRSPFPVPFFVAVFERLYSRQPHRNRAESHAHPRRHADIDERCHQLFLRVASAATCCWRCAICAWVCSLTTRGRTNGVW